MGAFRVAVDQPMPMVGHELSTALIKRDCVAEVADSSIGVYEWEGAWNQPDGANGIPTQYIRPKTRSAGGKTGIPYTKELYLDIYRKSLLELDALIPTRFVVASEHLVREGNLLVVTCWK